MRSGRRLGDPTAGVPGRRLFVAVLLPEATTEALTELVGEVRAAALPTGARDLRWVRLDGLHLTLRFLGPTLDDRLVDASASVLETAAEGAPIEVTLEGSGTFPVGRRPRALWVGVTEGRSELIELASRLNERLAKAGWPTDERPVSPHLTLARSDGLAMGSLVAGRLAAAMTDRRFRFTADTLGLFESVTGGGPARYVGIASGELGCPLDRTRVYHQPVPDQY